MRQKIVIFDMDGVLFDTIPFAERTTMESYPGMTSEMYRELHSGNYHEELKKHTSLKREMSEEEEARRRVAYSEQKKEASLFVGIESLLKDLRDAGYTLVLNSNAFTVNCLPLLERTGIKSLFDFIATADLSKSKVEKFRLIEEKYHVGAGGMLFVTDALGDVREAEFVGVPSIAVTWGVHDHTFFNREKHAHLIGIVDTVTELQNIIYKHFQ